MNKQFFCILLIIFSTNLFISAQKTGIRFFDNKNFRWTDPLLIGKAGSSIVVADRPDISGTPVYIIDSSYQLIKKIYLPRAAYGASSGTNGDHVFFLRQELQHDSIVYMMTKLNAAGNKEEIRTSLASSLSKRGYRELLTDKHNQYFLFYTLYKDNADNITIEGLLFDHALNLAKEVKHSFAVNQSLERFAPLLLDTKGNIHLMVYDQLTNYRLSANVRINTISLSEKEPQTETFQFDKKKFYDLIFFDNTGSSEIQLAGFYYNGNTKIKEGLASVRFPYARNKTMTEKFTALTEEQRKHLQNGMEHVRRKNDVMDFVKVKDIIEEDGQVYLSAWLLNLPQYLVVKDNEHEVPQTNNSNPDDWVRAGKKGVVEGLLERKPVEPRTDMNPPMPVIRSASLRDANNRMQGGNAFVTIDQNANSSNRNRSNIETKKPQLDDSYFSKPAVEPAKFAFFSINATQDNQWYQLVPGNFQVSSMSYQAGLWNYPLADKSGMYFISPDQAAKNMFISSINAKNAVVNPFTEELPLNYRYSKPLRIADGKHIVAFSSADKSGLAIVAIRE